MLSLEALMIVKVNNYRHFGRRHGAISSPLPSSGSPILTIQGLTPQKIPRIVKPAVWEKRQAVVAKKSHAFPAKG
jgi:hypothetical protein